MPPKKRNPTAERRPRAANFSTQESEVLIDISTQYQDILECKRSNTNVWRQKDSTWEKICVEFNAATTGQPRQVDELKSKYMNLKKVVKGKYAMNKREGYLTGGGESEAPNIEGTDEKLMAAIELSVKGLPSRNDSNSVPVKPPSSSVIKPGTFRESNAVPVKPPSSSSIKPGTSCDYLFEKSPPVSPPSSSSETDKHIEPPVDLRDDDVFEFDMNEQADEKDCPSTNEKDEKIDWSTWSSESLKSPINPVLKVKANVAGSSSSKMSKKSKDDCFMSLCKTKAKFYETHNESLPEDITEKRKAEKRRLEMEEEQHKYKIEMMKLELEMKVIEKEKMLRSLEPANSNLFEI